MGAKAIVSAKFIPKDEDPKTIRELIWTEFYIECKENGYSEADAKMLADLMTSDYTRDHITSTLT